MTECLIRDTRFVLHLTGCVLIGTEASNRRFQIEKATLEVRNLSSRTPQLATRNPQPLTRNP